MILRAIFIFLSKFYLFFMKARKGRSLPLTYSFDVPWSSQIGLRFSNLSSNNKIKNFCVRKFSSESNSTRFAGFITSQKRVLKTTFCSWLGCLANQLIPSNYTSAQIKNLQDKFDWLIFKINGHCESTNHDNLDDIDYTWALNIANPDPEEDYHDEERRTIAQFLNQNNNPKMNSIKNKDQIDNGKIYKMPRVIYEGFEFGGSIPVNLLLKKLYKDNIFEVDEDYFNGDPLDPESEFDFCRWAHNRHWVSTEAFTKYIIALYITIYQKQDANKWCELAMDYDSNHIYPYGKIKK